MQPMLQSELLENKVLVLLIYCILKVSILLTYCTQQIVIYQTLK